MRKPFLLLLYILLFVIYNSVYASSVTVFYPTLHTTNATPNNMSNLVPSMANYGDLSSYSDPVLLGTVQGGSNMGQTVGTGVSQDESGYVYVTGYTSGNGLPGQKQNGYYDYFIIKYGKDGKLIWSTQIGAMGGTTKGNGVSVDNSGNVYVTGSTTVALPNMTQKGMYDYFIAKYTPGGYLEWTRQVGAPGGTTLGSGISADKTGIYITGYTNVKISDQEQNGRNDYFIAKYESDGNLVWSKQVGASWGDTYGNGISADNYGNIYVTGTTTVGISGESQNGVYDYFIAKYDQESNIYWSRQVGAKNGYTFGSGISAVKYIDESGVKNESFGIIYVTGKTYAGISGQIQHGQTDYFIAKYFFSDGELIWTRQGGASNGYTVGNGVSTNRFGNAYITGQTSVGLNGQKQNGMYDYFIAKYDVRGSFQWNRQVGGVPSGTTSGNGISVADNLVEFFYVVGQTTIGLSGQKQTGAWDYFIAQYIK